MELSRVSQTGRCHCAGVGATGSNDRRRLMCPRCPVKAEFEEFVWRDQTGVRFCQSDARPRSVPRSPLACLPAHAPEGQPPPAGRCPPQQGIDVEELYRDRRVVRERLADAAGPLLQREYAHRHLLNDLPEDPAAQIRRRDTGSHQTPRSNGRWTAGCCGNFGRAIRTKAGLLPQCVT
jgi:hypothetical protein